MAKRQKTQLELAFGTEGKGEARTDRAEGTEAVAAGADVESPAACGPSMERVVERDNLRKALAQVQRNKGAPGADGMTVSDLAAHLKDHWPAIRSQLLAGTYTPQPVRRVEIPKASGGTRALGIPTVIDRFIQQAVLQVLQADWDGTFSDASFGFRPGRSAHMAVAKAQEHIASGHRIVVDMDLEKFFVAGVERFLEKRLKLKVNRAKSAVARPFERKFLGFSFTTGATPRRRLARETLVRFKHRVRETTRRTRGKSLAQIIAELARYLNGWRGYFGFCETPSVLRDLDQWVRRRLRAIAWKQWKRGPTRFAELRRRGIGKDLAAQSAGSPNGPWRMSNSPALAIALPNAYRGSLGLPFLAPAKPA
jgi:hypothetical protein